MNALAPPRTLALDDKYRVTGDTVFLTGIQALVRIPLLRRQLDAALGLDTAGFISGYRGSPLGGLDGQLWHASALLAEHDIVFQPAINEDLGVTAVWGSQQVNLYPGARHEGVFALWYAKGPGVDRSGDALKHANFAGTSPLGGVLAVAGDDHACKSSSMPNQSEFAFIDAEMPVLHPAGVADLLEFGVKGLALSRHSGLWVGLKTIADTADSSATVFVDPNRYRTVAPGGVALPEDGLNIRLPDSPQAQELRHRHFRLPAAQAFARRNGFDRVVIDSPRPRLGIVTSGKAYLHVREALRDLGISEDRAAGLGIRLLKVGMAWPLDPVTARAFADGLAEVLVVEERRDVIELQLRAIAYDLPDGRRPRILGKRDLAGRPLVPDLLDLDTATVTRVLFGRLPEESRTGAMRAHMARLDDIARDAAAAPIHVRSPYFCSGCPHNSSTKLPEGSRAAAGIGCHFLVQWMDRNSEAFTHMGGEGVTWLGQAPFTAEKHIFANLGDGTYFHSGSLAVRQAIAAGVNITYKILYNDAVAMTGGQHVDGTLTVPMIVAQMAAEGVKRIAIVSDEPERHRGDPLIPAWVTFDHRDRLEAVQKELREQPGCSILIYDQTCATELRRRRKRGTVPARDHRVVINEAVCEDCGDCSKASNCVSVEPVETEFGTKRQIDQSSCNQDFACVDGFCPSFVSVYGAQPRKAAAGGADIVELPIPDVAVPGDDACNILLAGIGGQGVTSLSAIIGTAAHLEGRAVRVLDQLGMAQKGGGVTAHIRIASRDEMLHSPRIGAGQADLLIAADMVVAHGKAALPELSRQRTHVILNGDLIPTAEFVRDNATRYDRAGMLRRLARASRAIDEIPAGDIATAAFGDAIYVNVFLLGLAAQKGLLPVGVAALEKAIALNGTAVEMNLRAFRLGRRAAVEREAVTALVPSRRKPATALNDILAIRVRALTAYQHAAYARDYEAFVARVRAAEQAAMPGRDDLARAVARGLFKLMAYKDEYEVARLFTDGTFQAGLRRQFAGELKLRFHMAPPLLTRRDPDTGLAVKRSFGPWIMPALRLLARMKRLRGTPFDIFGYAAERRTERALIAEYRGALDRLLPLLTPESHGPLVAFARTAETIKGYGHVKEANIAKARQRFAEIEAEITRSLRRSTPRLAAE